MNKYSSNKALFAGVAGTALQWYEFAIFGYFAPIIARTFFPETNEFAALLSAFGIFAVGHLLAPLGALYFGYVGDRHGRKRALSLSIIAMAIPTALMSFIPSYALIGIAAPILMTLLRLIQGFVAGSEFTGSAIFLVEHAPKQKKAFYGCLTSSAYSAGMMLAGLAASFFTASFMPEWGWRINGVVAVVGALIIYYLRTQVSETPDFQKIQQRNDASLPFIMAVKEAPHLVLGIIGIAWLVGIMTFGTYLYTATYLNQYFNISLSDAAFIITIALVVDALLEPFIAILADKLGLLLVIMVGMVAMLLLSIPIFYLLSSGSLSRIIMGMILMSTLIAITYAPLNAYMVTLFPKEYRYSGFGFAFNLGASLFGGTTPIIMLWLIDQSDNVLAPAWYYIFGAVIGLGSLVLCEFGRQKVKSAQSVLAY